MPKATQTILSYIRESDKSKVLKRITEMEIIHITKNIEKNSDLRTALTKMNLP